jgi:hypothetical protein
MYTSLLSLLEFPGHPLHLNPVATRPQPIHRIIMLPKLLRFQLLACSISSANLPGESSRGKGQSNLKYRDAAEAPQT